MNDIMADKDFNMLKTGMNENLPGPDMEQRILETPVFHNEYEVRNESGINLGIQLLIFYFGELWTSAMNRLNPKIDGHLFDIRHQGVCFSVYRTLKINQMNEHPYLRLVEKKPL
ncbi:MAG: hypothetical protein R6X10_15400 [Desulfobacterales bacterium]